MDRGFAVAFAVSLGFHLSLVAIRLPSMNWLRAPREQQALEVIYDNLPAEGRRQIEERLAQAGHKALEAPAPTGGIGRTSITVPDHPLVSGRQMWPDVEVERSAVIDLTDLMEAAQGNPSLLSYFSAIRAEIQDAANRETWMTHEGYGGLVYVSFVLRADGQAQAIAVVKERSASSPTLQRIALQIVQSAAPFPPFPPSLKAERKTVVVPLEFLVGP